MSAAEGTPLLLQDLLIQLAMVGDRETIQGVRLSVVSIHPRITTE